MNRFFTPLLRRVYVFFAAFLAVYLVLALVQRSAWNKERLYAKLLSGQREARLAAAAGLIQLGAQDQLLRALRTRSPVARDLAENALWELWFRAAGDEAYELTMKALRAVEKGDFAGALNLLDKITAQYPRFAEGWNRRAKLYWQVGKYQESLADCRKVVELNPVHFAAWQGLAMCQVHLGDVEAAAQAVRKALQIKPHDGPARRFLRHCEDLLHPGSRREAARVSQA